MILDTSAVIAVIRREQGASDLEEREVVSVPFERRHWRAAQDAFVRFGKSRHPAGLNLGDCMSYATASVAGEPLLFTGNDFARTDIAPA